MKRRRRPLVTDQVEERMVSAIRARRAKSNNNRTIFFRLLLSVPVFRFSSVPVEEVVGLIVVSLLGMGVPKNSSRALWGIRKRPCL